MLIYVDESGDLGWSFDRPYGHGGSSRFLTIAAMLVPDELDHLPRRKVKHLYQHGHWDKAHEKKWVDMPAVSRLTFATNAASLVRSNPQIGLCAIVVNKQRVSANFQRDSNKLYNYMLKLLLVDEMKKHRYVTLIPDPPFYQGRKWQLPAPLPGNDPVRSPGGDETRDDQSRQQVMFEFAVRRHVGRCCGHPLRISKIRAMANAAASCALEAAFFLTLPPILVPI